MANTKASIQFGDQDYSELITGDLKVLMIGKNTELNPKFVNGEVFLGRQDLQADVCTEVEFNARDKDTGDPIKVDWLIQVGNGDAKPIKEIKEIIDKSNLTEGYIKFVIPKEWGQKNIVLTAIQKIDPKKKASGNIYIRDHIVAAFFRLNNKVAHRKKLLDLKKVKNVKKNYINLFGPVHHHQGMYKVDKTYYISGSTIINVPTYTYKLQEESEGSYSLEKVILFDKGVLNRYRHAGGLQVANGLMAIGIEKYNYNLFTGFLGSASQDKSVVCFMEDGVENEHLRIVREDETEYFDACDKYQIGKISKKDNILIEGRDYASATGIVFIEGVDASDDEKATTSGDENFTATANNKENSDKPKSNGRYIVVVRGDDQAVRFYEIDGDKKNITPLGVNDTSTGKDDKPKGKNKKPKGKNKKPKGKNNTSTGEDGKPTGKNFSEIGEFQNVNLHLNEKGEVYMFGMGKSKMGGVDKCKIYRVDLSPSDVNLLDVWINDQGLIQEQKAGESKLNELVFECQDGTSFHWASCIQMIASKNRTEETDLKKQTAENGFEGTFAVYTINYEVLDYEIDEYALERAYESDKLSYYNDRMIRNNDESIFRSYPLTLSQFRELNGRIYSNPVDAHIVCNYFKEDIDND